MTQELEIRLRALIAQAVSSKAIVQDYRGAKCFRPAWVNVVDLLSLLATAEPTEVDKG